LLETMLLSFGGDMTYRVHYLAVDEKTAQDEAGYSVA
jgi:hypothetical protein